MIVNASITNNNNTIGLISQTPVDWDAFIPWANQLLHQILNIDNFPITVDKQPTEDKFFTDSGADLHMLRFTFQQQQFSLNYEAYSDSIWIAPEVPAAATALPALLSIVTTIIDNNNNQR